MNEGSGFVRVIIAGGGTGGHVYPGISVADAFKDKDKATDILFVGTKKGMEAELIPKTGYPFETIRVSGFQRKISPALLKSAGDALAGFSQAGKIVESFSPDLVIGTGGYVCGPVVGAARRKKISTMILEQNVIPGVTNRLLGRLVDGVAVTYDKSREYFPGRRQVVVTGNPVRKQILSADRKMGRENLKIGEDKMVVMGFGGSIGAKKINEAMVHFIKEYALKNHLTVILITGKDKYEETKKQIGEAEKDILEKGKTEKKAGDIILKPYLHNIEDAYGAADLIVCRAGGISLSELTAIGRPAVVIPYPYATNQHQDHNARYLTEVGAAVSISDGDLDGPCLTETIKDLVENETNLQNMAQKSKELGRPDAAESIITLAEDIVRRRRPKRQRRS